MRAWVMMVVVMLGAVSLAHAGPPPSPRIAALAARPATVSAFWKQAASEGTPIVEDVHDPKGRLLVTFVYRARPGTKHVAMYNAPTLAPAGYARLERIAGTDVFAWSALVDPAARFTYWFAPDDDFGPPGEIDDFAKRVALFRTDSLNKHPSSGPGRMTALVELPRAPAQPELEPRRDSPAGELVEYEVTSKALGNHRPVMVYTPAGFSTHGAVYPLVVTFDAPVSVTEVGLPIVLDNLIAASKIPPVVVMFVGNADRSKELPHDAAFADFVALDLVPWVRRTYHATDDPRLTVIAGISFGGIAATFAASRHPAVYGNVLSQSGSYWWSPDDAVEGEAHAHEYATRSRLPLRFWLEVGTLEGGTPKPGTSQLAANRHFRDVLVARGYDVSYREFQGEHEYINWRGTIGDGLVALLAKPPRFADKPPASPGSAGGIEVGDAQKTIFVAILRMALLDGGAATVAWLEHQDAALVTEDAVNDFGYMLLSFGHPQAAVPIFEWNVARFPTSWNAHDSLADAYNRAGDRAHAVASYQRSLALDPKNANARMMLDILR